MAKKTAAKKKIVFKNIPKGEIKSWKDVSPRSSETKDTRPQSSMSDKLREARSRGEPKLESPKPRPAADTKKGDLRSKYSAGPKKPSAAGAAARTVLKTAARVAGPVGALASMTTAAGAGSDKPSGKLFSPSANRAAGKGNPKTVNPSTPKKRAMPAAGSGMSFNGIKPSPATPAPKPKAKPSSTPPRPSTKAPKPTMKPSKGPASGKMSYTPPKKPSFSGNWQGAAPSEMQARGGARKTGSSGILGAIKRKMGK